MIDNSKKYFLKGLLVLVPDGLRLGKLNKSYLTNTYRNVLKKAIEESYKNKLKILLLPANNFGSLKSEEEMGKDYLLKRGIKKNMIIIGCKKDKRYLDTLDNFNQVNLYGGKIGGKSFKVHKYLESGNYNLFTSNMHARRVLKVIKLLKMGKPKRIFLISSVESGSLPKRIFYYKYPIIHNLYEIFANIHLNLKMLWL